MGFTASGVIAEWKLDGDVSDYSQNQIHIAYTTGARVFSTSNPPPPFGRTSLNVAPGNAFFAGIPPTTNKSISYRIMFPTGGATLDTIYCRDWATTAYFGAYLTAGLDWRANSNPSYNEGSIMTAARDKWYFMYIEADSTNSQVRYYVDGTLRRTLSNTNLAAITGFALTTNLSNERLSRAMYFNRFLTANEQNILMNFGTLDQPPAIAF